MFCRTCGKEINDKAVVCVGCGVPPLAGDGFCQNCGSPSNPAASVCIKCGGALKGSNALLSGGNGDVVFASDPPKDPVLMAVLSGCCVAWLGQIILGQTTKGLVLLAVSVSLAFAGIGFVFWPLAAVDAYLIAKKLKEGKTVGQWEFF